MLTGVKGYMLLLKAIDWIKKHLKNLPEELHAAKLAAVFPAIALALIEQNSVTYGQQLTADVPLRQCPSASEELRRPAKLRDSCGELDTATPYCGLFLSLMQ